MNFSDFKLTPQLSEGLASMGFETATPIQEQGIPLILKGLDLIACAQTGTGKTAAYLLPIIHKLTEKKEDQHSFKCLIIVPTRELAIQIDQQVEGFAYFCPVSSVAVFGGSEGSLFDSQKVALMEGAEIVIATPGRLISHLNLGYVKTDEIEYLILDEADRMLDMGFFDDIMKIINQIPKKRQTLMFSATMPEKIRHLSKKLLHKPEQISLEVSKPAENVVQVAYFVEDRSKIALIEELLKGKEDVNAIIFSSRKSSVKEIERAIRKLGITVSAIHSDLEQRDREQTLLDFKNKKIRLLVATDVISRGIDIVGISMVLNYDVPREPEDYIHRIGRTARADESGLAMTFINHSDRLSFQKIEKFLGNSIYKIPLPEHLHVAESTARDDHHKKFPRKPGFKRK